MNSNAKGLSESPAVWGLPGTIIWGIFIIVVLILAQVMAIAVYTARLHPGVDPDEIGSLMERYFYHGQAIAYALITALVVCLPLVTGIIKIKKNTNLDHYLGFRPAPLRLFGYWILIYLGCSVASDLVTFILGREIVPEFSIDIYETGSRSLLFWIAILFVAPLLEEVIFRGFLFTGIAASMLGPVGAVLLTSMAWAAIHLQYDLYGQASIFVLGIVLGMARYKTGSTFVTFGLHALHNLLAMTITAYVANMRVLQA